MSQGCRNVNRRLVAAGIGKAANLSFRVTVFLAAANSGWGIAQTAAATPEKSSAQYQRSDSDAGDPAQGQRIALTTCAACHGAGGNSANPQFPKLAGQKTAYLYWQLVAFRRGTRASAVMSGIASTLSDADMANVASYYAE